MLIMLNLFFIHRYESTGVISNCLPGQGCSLQAWLSRCSWMLLSSNVSMYESLLWQLAPLFVTGGLSQSRVRVWFPPAQDLLQLVQFSQFPQAPLTIHRKWFIFLNLNIKAKVIYAWVLLFLHDMIWLPAFVWWNIITRMKSNRKTLSRKTSLMFVLLLTT